MPDGENKTFETKPINIKKLFEKVYGYRGLPFPYQSKPFDELGGGQINDYAQLVGGIFNRTTKLGIKVFMPFAIQFDDIDPGLPFYQLPNEPTVQVSTSKRIVETALVGTDPKQPSRGTVKELIGNQDYDITIQGIAINEPEYYKIKGINEYPGDTIGVLNDLYNLNKALEIHHALLRDVLGIQHIVITSISFPRMVGVQNAQAYEIQARSDSELVLTIKN